MNRRAQTSPVRHPQSTERADRGTAADERVDSGVSRLFSVAELRVPFAVRPRELQCHHGSALWASMLAQSDPHEPLAPVVRFLESVQETHALTVRFDAGRERPQFGQDRVFTSPRHERWWSPGPTDATIGS